MQRRVAVQLAVDTFCEACYLPSLPLYPGGSTSDRDSSNLLWHPCGVESIGSRHALPSRSQQCCSALCASRNVRVDAHSCFPNAIAPAGRPATCSATLIQSMVHILWPIAISSFSVMQLLQMFLSRALHHFSLTFASHCLCLLVHLKCC